MIFLIVQRSQTGDWMFRHAEYDDQQEQQHQIRVQHFQSEVLGRVTLFSGQLEQNQYTISSAF